MILLSTLILNTAVGSHEDPDKAEKDVGDLLVMLSNTKEDIERSLKEGLWVNYTLEWRENGTLSEDYREDHLNISKEIAINREEVLSKPDLVSSEIKGVVNSSDFLEDYYIPFYLLSSNLTRYATRHHSLISNLTRITQIIQGSLNESTQKGEGIGELFINSRNHLDQMEEEILPKIEKNRERIDENFFDITELDRLIEDNYDLIDEYRKELEKLVGDVPSALTIYGPEKGHPGTRVDIHGYFLREGEFVTNATVSLNISTGNNETINISTFEGYYEYTYNISWGQEIAEEIIFSAMVDIDGEKIRSKNLTVDIDPYPSSIELEKEKDAYYNETIEIVGEFKTDADVNVSGTKLKTSFNETITINEEGYFNLSYGSREFRWGVSDLRVNYDGAKYLFSLNRTKYMEYLDEGSIDPELKGAFEDESYDVEADANLSEEDEGWFISENETREYRIEVGDEKLTIYEAGNETISPSSSGISFEVSIPTGIVDLDYPKVMKKTGTDEFALNGKLLNVSSGEGIEGQNLSISLNSEMVRSVETGDGGNFTFVFSKERELQSGQHVLDVHFEGTEKFREARSEDIQIEVKEEEPFWKSYTFIGSIAVLITVVLILVYVFTGKEEEKKEEEGVDEKVSEPSPKISVPSANSGEDIPETYRNFLDLLQSSGFIDFSRGKTHQELEREISSHPKLKELEDHIRYVTDRFEKVLFTDRSISSSEIEEFNSSISKLTEEVSS
ncbi:MAG: hypothetical protein KGY76_03915 [Candidatus Thermoplasmatota archaeon]|nr:hypothetical protein [Candidatus Thermoplasmatota archaeon]